MKRFPALDIRFTPEAETAGALHDRLAAGLDDFHPTAIEEASTVWRVFFDTSAARDAALGWLRALGDARIAVGPIDVEDDDWARRSQADLQPVRAGRIVVTPPWAADAARDAKAAGELVIVIVPSTGFGTGHHASTRLCLELLQGVPVRGRTALDVGTGSGVLAIAAARLGARSVAAIDNDPDAIASAEENIALNAVAVHLACAEFARPSTPSDGGTDGTADIVLANLTGQLLRRIAPDVIARTNRAGDIIVSGVLATEQAEVVAAFESAGARLVGTKAADEWVGLHFGT